MEFEPRIQEITRHATLRIGRQPTHTLAFQHCIRRPAARMEKSLHAHYLKHTIFDSNGQLKMTEKTGLQMVQDIRLSGPQNSLEKTGQITVLDIDRDIASAKLVTAHWVDYIMLSKWNGGWKIVSVVLRENN